MKADKTTWLLLVQNPCSLVSAELNKPPTGYRQDIQRHTPRSPTSAR